MEITTLIVLEKQAAAVAHLVIDGTWLPPKDHRGLVHIVRFPLPFSLCWSEAPRLLSQNLQRWGFKIEFLSGRFFPVSSTKAPPCPHGFAHVFVLGTQKKISKCSTLIEQISQLIEKHKDITSVVTFGREILKLTKLKRTKMTEYGSVVESVRLPTHPSQPSPFLSSYASSSSCFPSRRPPSSSLFWMGWVQRRPSLFPLLLQKKKHHRNE